MRCLFPAMPVVTLAGSEENGMGRGGRARPRRQRLYEVDVNGPVDLTEEDGWWLEGLPALGTAPPEVEPIEVDLGEFLATHTATDEQIALLHQFITGAGDPATIWKNLLASMMDSIALSVAEEADSN